MRKRQASIADFIIEANGLLDGRYRLDREIRRSATTTIHLATHRNGSTAWLKMPLTAAFADQIALEARIANTIGSPLVVRDDGTTPDRIPYLILDPPNAESVADLRARGKAGARAPLSRVMTAGDALARVVASIHAIGYATAGLADEDVIVFDTADVALLDLHALTPLTPEGTLADVKHVLRVLGALLAEVSEPTSARPAIDTMLAGTYPDVAALQAAWRGASPEPIITPIRTRSGSSFADLPPASTPALAPASAPGYDTPLAVAMHTPAEAMMPAGESSIIGYLRSPETMPEFKPQRPAQNAVMYDPLTKVAEVSRLVQAASHVEEKPKRRGHAIGMIAAFSGVALVLAAVGIAVALSQANADAKPQAAAAVEALPTAVQIIANAKPLPVEKADAIDLTLAATTAPAAPSGGDIDELENTATLRTQNAPAGRVVFIDGKAIGTTPLDGIAVPCGSHQIQMVAGGPKQTVDLACGSTRTVKYDAKGHWALK